MAKPDEIYDLPMDIYAPCALGASVNSTTLTRLKCAIIAGAANNQLEDEHMHGEMIKEKGIIYAPDFLINAGGVINVAQELEGYNEKRSMERVEKIYDRTLEIFKMADTENMTTHSAALRMAEKRIHDVARIKARI
jgi:leucine dehydrogenase